MDESALWGVDRRLSEEGTQGGMHDLESFVGEALGEDFVVIGVPAVGKAANGKGADL